MYNYQKMRPTVFTEGGVMMLLSIRDRIRECCKMSGACQFANAMTSGDTWEQLACVDYLVERGDIRRVTPPDTPGQDQIFTWVKSLE